MTDPQSHIHELLGIYSPVFSLYSALLNEKLQFDLSEISLCGKNDRNVYANPCDGFRVYLIERERSDRVKRLNTAVTQVFSFLNELLNDKNELLTSFQHHLLFSSKALEAEAFSVYSKAFYGE